MGDSEYVPWPTFEKNIRGFIDTILAQTDMAQTKIVVITPPPIACPAPLFDPTLPQEQIEEVNERDKQLQRYRTYMSKKNYAEGLLRVAKDYEETGRVVGLNFWQNIVDALLQEQGDVYNAEMPPGCGLIGAKTFGKGWFTDGLHMDVKGYNVLSNNLFTLVTKKWPELAPEFIQKS
jgi:isoamyl acetate esterase